VHLARALELDDEGAFGIRAEGNVAGDAFGLDGANFVEAAARGEALSMMYSEVCAAAVSGSRQESVT